MIRMFLYIVPLALLSVFFIRRTKFVGWIAELISGGTFEDDMGSFEETKETLEQRAKSLKLSTLTLWPF